MGSHIAIEFVVLAANDPRRHYQSEKKPEAPNPMELTLIEALFGFELFLLFFNLRYLLSSEPTISHIYDYLGR